MYQYYKFSPPCINIQCPVFIFLYHRDIPEMLCPTVTDMRMLSVNASQGCINQLRALCTLRFDVFIWTVLPNQPNLTWLICWVLCSCESTCLYTTSSEKTGHGVCEIAVFFTILNSPPFSFLWCIWTALFLFGCTLHHRLRRRCCLVVVFLTLKKNA